MATLRISFLWEESAEMDYDGLIDQLMFLGAEDITDEVVEEKPVERGPARHKKPKPSEGIALPTGDD